MRKGLSNTNDKVSVCDKGQLLLLIWMTYGWHLYVSVKVVMAIYKKTKNFKYVWKKNFIQLKWTRTDLKQNLTWTGCKTYIGHLQEEILIFFHHLLAATTAWLVLFSYVSLCVSSWQECLPGDTCCGKDCHRSVFSTLPGVYLSFCHWANVVSIIASQLCSDYSLKLCSCVGNAEFKDGCDLSRGHRK